MDKTSKLMHELMHKTTRKKLLKIASPEMADKLTSSLCKSGTLKKMKSGREITFNRDIEGYNSMMVDRIKNISEMVKGSIVSKHKDKLENGNAVEIVKLSIIINPDLNLKENMAIWICRQAIECYPQPFQFTKKGVEKELNKKYTMRQIEDSIYNNKLISPLSVSKEGKESVFSYSL